MSNHKLKAGNYAVIAAGAVCEDNVSKLVQLLRPVFIGDLPAWEVRCAEKLATIESDGSVHQMYYTGIVCETRLVPVNLAPFAKEIRKGLMQGLQSFANSLKPNFA